MKLNIGLIKERDTMKILGISAYYHDSAAALIVDGRIAAAAQEERFTRIKHDASFPVHAVRYCLSEAECDLSSVDYVVYYEKPLLKLDRLLETYLAYVPKGFSSFRRAIPVWVKEKMFLKRELIAGLKHVSGDKKFTGRLVYTQHHESHAASAFFPSPYEDAAILTVDGVGEWTTTAIGKGNGNRIELMCKQQFPHSLGLLYSAFTYYTGFKVNSGEYKLMGLAPYGQPKYCELIETNLIDLKEDGSFWMNMAFFDYCVGLTMTNDRFHDLFGRGPREPESPISQFYMDIAASIQKTTEKILDLLVRHCYELTQSKHLCLAGGVALNCVANGKILKDGPFENIWIQPAAGDSGGALGAALFVWYQLLENERLAGGGDSQNGSYLGPEFTDEQITSYLDSKGVDYRVHHSEDELVAELADHLADQKIVGWFQGRMEFGPRALGARSILGDPRGSEMQKKMNLKIKFRESFRPFAPSVLRECAHDFFNIPEQVSSPYMLLVGEVNEEHRCGKPEELKQASGFEKLSVERSDLPAVTHVDYSARIQTLDKETHPLYYKLIKAFEALTGCPLLVNTSFNVRGEPIVCTPDDAFNCFMATEMDLLVMGNVILHKDQIDPSEQVSRDDYLSQFRLD